MNRTNPYDRHPRHAAGVCWRTAVAAILLAATVACGANRAAQTGDPSQPDRFLLDRGTAALTDKKWLDAREYFRQVVDNYPQSPVRPDAKLGIGESYLGEGTAESLVLSASEFREFLTFYPTSARADYAQYKLAMTHFQQMRAPERDQSETKEALKEFQVFFDRFPDSPLVPEVKQKWRAARDRLSAASYRVGLHYHRVRWYPGAMDRFREILKDDPEFTERDAVYFYLADILARTDKKAEAIPYFERLLTEFPQSELVEDTRKRLQVLKSQ
jgi:outer membrane protein assembly factor BamD